MKSFQSSPSPGFISECHLYSRVFLGLRGRLTILWMAELLILGIGFPWGEMSSARHHIQPNGFPLPWIEIDWRERQTPVIEGISSLFLLFDSLCMLPLALRASRRCEQLDAWLGRKGGNEKLREVDSIDRGGAA